jgi:hypothetical protein
MSPASDPVLFVLAVVLLLLALLAVLLLGIGLAKLVERRRSR